MNGAFYIGAIGLDAQQRALEVVANNIANINTAGFKRSSVRFSELIGAVRDESDVPVVLSDRTALMSGVAINATPHVWSEGPLQQTGQQLDIAIDGPGFLELLGPSGRSLLWRGGTLKVNPDGFLAASDGTPLREQISVPQDASALTIDRDGKVSALVGNDKTAQQLGQLELTMVKSPDDLVDVGNGYYELTDAAGAFTVQPDGQEGGGALVQGALESSNVQLADEMTSLLLTQRAFASNAQVVQAGDQLMSIVNGLRR